MRLGTRRESLGATVLWGREDDFVSGGLRKSAAVSRVGGGILGDFIEGQGRPGRASTKPLGRGG